MKSFLKTFQIACIPAAFCGAITYYVIHKNTLSQIKLIQAQNRRNFNELIQQNRVTIDSIKEKYEHEISEKDRLHQRNLELIKKENEDKSFEQDKETESNESFTIKDVMGGMFGGILSQAINSPEIQEKINNTILETIKINNNTST